MLLDVEATAVTETPEPRKSIEVCAQRMLGRLSRRVQHLMVSVRQHDQTARGNVHACTLRLRAQGVANDILIETFRPSRDAAVEAALRQARHELIRRRAAARSGQSLHALPAAA